MKDVLSKDDYATMQQADIIMDGAVRKVISENGMCNWTVCPVCKVDDFQHIEGCELIDNSI